MYAVPPISIAFGGLFLDYVLLLHRFSSLVSLTLLQVDWKKFGKITDIQHHSSHLRAIERVEKVITQYYSNVLTADDHVVGPQSENASLGNTDIGGPVVTDAHNAGSEDRSDDHKAGSEDRSDDLTGHDQTTFSKKRSLESDDEAGGVSTKRAKKDVPTDAGPKAAVRKRRTTQEVQAENAAKAAEKAAKAAAKAAEKEAKVLQKQQLKADKEAEKARKAAEKAKDKADAQERKLAEKIAKQALNAIKGKKPKSKKNSLDQAPDDGSDHDELTATLEAVSNILENEGCSLKGKEVSDYPQVSGMTDGEESEMDGEDGRLGFEGDLGEANEFV